MCHPFGRIFFRHVTWAVWTPGFVKIPRICVAITEKSQTSRSPVNPLESPKHVGKTAKWIICEDKKTKWSHQETELIRVWLAPLVGSNSNLTYGLTFVFVSQLWLKVFDTWKKVWKNNRILRTKKMSKKPSKPPEKKRVTLKLLITKHYLFGRWKHAILWTHQTRTNLTQVFTCLGGFFRLPKRAWACQKPHGETGCIRRAGAKKSNKLAKCVQTVTTITWSRFAKCSPV